MSGYIVRTFRGAELPDQYRGLVFSRWLLSYKWGNDFMRMAQRKGYFPAYRSYVARLINDPECVIRIAVLADDHDVALGFSVCRATCLDYVHVHKDHRLQGIATKLIPADIKVFSHATKDGFRAIGKKNPKWKLEPFKIKEGEI